MRPALQALTDTPGLRPFAPLILAAWEDEWLTPGELSELRQALLSATWLDDAQRQQATRWLDPDAPPSPHELRQLRAHVGSVMADIAPKDRNTLQRFGAALVSGELAEAQREDVLQVLANAARLLHAREFERGRWLPREARVARGAAPYVAHREASWVARVQAEVEGSEVETRAQVRRALEEGSFQPPRGLSTPAYRAQVRAWLCELVERGVVAHCYPNGLRSPRHTGRFIATFETLAQFDLSLVVKFGVQAGLFAGAVEQLGGGSHGDLVAQALHGELWGCFAMTERGHGSDVRSLRTTATYEPDAESFVIHSPDASAGKEWIGNAAEDGQVAVVFAQLTTLGEDHGVHAFLVPIRDAKGNPKPGVRIEDCGEKMGLNGVDNGRLWFDEVRVPRTALLSRFGNVSVSGEYDSPIPSAGKRFFRMLSTLVGGRVAVGGAANAAAKVGLTTAIHYASRRRQFEDSAGAERPILDYVTHRQRLMPKLAGAYAYTMAQNELVQLMDRSTDATLPAALSEHDVETLAAGLKAMATWHATSTLQTCRECCGGQGYLSDNRIDALRTDVDVFTTFEGDNTVLLSLVANNLLRTLRRALRDKPLRSVASSVVEDVTFAVTERNPWSRRDGSDDALRDRSLVADALQFRERSLLSSLARRIKSRTDDGATPQRAFEQCQDHALRLSKAHVERFAFDALSRATERCSELEPLALLFGLGCLERDLGWFFEKGFVASPRAQALRRVTAALCNEVAADALDWTRALAVPSLCTGPLADDHYLEASGLGQPPAAESTAPEAQLAPER